MNFISNLKIKNKLILMLVFPIAGLIYFSLSGIWDKSKLTSEMDSLQTLSKLTVKISSLVHEIQKERGITSVFLGSKGNEFASELSKQISETDRKVTDLQTFLKDFDIHRFGVEFKGTMDSALNNLKNIKGRRDSTSKITVSAEETFEYYTNTISSFLDVISYISKLSANVEIATMTASYVNLLQEKERVGRERALLSNTFAADKFKPEMFNKYISVIAEQDTYMNVFLSFASSAQKDFYKKKIQGKFVDEVARMRKIALERSDKGGFGVDPSYCYRIVTGKIDLLKEVEDKISSDLNLKAEEFKNNAQLALTFFIVVTIIAVFTSSFLAYLIMRAITHPLRKMIGSSQKIATGDLTADIKISSKDEVGTLAVAFKEMASNLIEMLKKTKALSTNVDTAVKKIVSGATSIRRGSEDQATAMTDVSFSVEGLHKMALDIANGMEQSLKLSEETSSSILEMALSIEEADRSVAEITFAVEDTSTSIEEIASSLKEVAIGTDNISKGADEIASSLIQIDTSAMEIERHSGEGAGLSNEVAREGEMGLKAVGLTHAGMETIKGEVKKLATVIEELGQRSKEIGKILNVIDDVAVETNLLALNATILAAQAGEHGKGFGVVAHEIRELSERTSASTKEITGIISGIQSQIGKAVVSVEETIAKVTEGEKLSIDTIGILEGITGRFKTFQDMSLKISRATQEQTRGSKEVTQNMEDITATIHQIARATQEQSQGSTQIVNSLENMKELISHLKKLTSEQAEGSKVIASNTEKMMRFIQDINVLSSDQEKESQRISAAVMETTTIAGAGMENTSYLEEIVNVLKKEVETLKEGLERFRLE